MQNNQIIQRYIQIKKLQIHTNRLAKEETRGIKNYNLPEVKNRAKRCRLDEERRRKPEDGDGTRRRRRLHHHERWRD